MSLVGAGFAFWVFCKQGSGVFRSFLRAIVMAAVPFGVWVMAMLAVMFVAHMMVGKRGTPEWHAAMDAFMPYWSANGAGFLAAVILTWGFIYWKASS